MVMMVFFEIFFMFFIDMKFGNFVLSLLFGMVWGIFFDNWMIGDYGFYLGLMNSLIDNFFNKVFVIEIDIGFSEFFGYNDISSCYFGVDFIMMRFDFVFDMVIFFGS